jgi:hypothetical protein
MRMMLPVISRVCDSATVSQVWLAGTCIDMEGTSGVMTCGRIAPLHQALEFRNACQLLPSYLFADEYPEMY